MEKKYKCEKCGSVSDNSGTCCNIEKTEVSSVSVSKSKCDMNHIWPGAKAGIIAGIVFAAMMTMSGSLPKIASLFGSHSVTVGLIVHLIFSAIIGATFGLLFGHKVKTKGKGITLGLLWGFIWWILGPLLIMPIWLGMGSHLTATGIVAGLGTLPGHLVFGFILGLVFSVNTLKNN